MCILNENQIYLSNCKNKSFRPIISYDDVLIEGKRNGFYVEAGALDGELHSNTLFFELNRNFSGMIYSFETSKYLATKVFTKYRNMVYINNESFSGLLIEPSLDYNKLLTKHRKAYSINSCLSRRNTSETVEFLSHKAIGGIKGNTNSTR